MRDTSDARNKTKPVISQDGKPEREAKFERCFLSTWDWASSAATFCFMLNHSVTGFNRTLENLSQPR